MKGMFRFFKISLGLLMIFMMGTLGGCADTNVERNTSAALREFVPITDIKDGQLDVYFIGKAYNNNYWDTMETYIGQAGTELGCNVYSSGSDTEVEWGKQVQLLDKAVEAGADAIIIAPDNSVKLAEPVSKVHAKGVSVILIDTALTIDDYDVCYMTDNLLAGQQAAIELMKQLEKAGYTDADELKVGIQAGSSSSLTINERLAGFSQYWIKNAPASWVITDELKVNDGDIALAERLSDEILTDSDVKGVFGCNNGSTVGLVRAIVKGERKDVAIVGFDYSDDMAGLIETPGYCAATMLQKQYDMGYYSVKSALDLSQGIVNDRKFVDTGVVVVNQDSINTEEIKEILSR